MTSRKADFGDVDEDFLLDSIKSGHKDEPPPTEGESEKSKTPAKRKRDYGSIYLQRNEIKTRQCVYISRNIHNKILKIVSSIAEKEISVGGYIDTVLAQHLEAHREEINELYRKWRQGAELI